MTSNPVRKFPESPEARITETPQDVFQAQLSHNPGERTLPARAIFSGRSEAIGLKYYRLPEFTPSILFFSGFCIKVQFKVVLGS